jgi:hypothetical protein
MRDGEVSDDVFALIDELADPADAAAYALIAKLDRAADPLWEGCGRKAELIGKLMS